MKKPHLSHLVRYRSTLAAMRAANDECIEWMESCSGPPEEEAEEFDPCLAIVVKQLDDGKWDVFFSADIDRHVDECDIAYVLWPGMKGARTRADVIELLKSDIWRSETNSMARQYASVHYTLAYGLVSDCVKPADKREPASTGITPHTAVGRPPMPLVDIQEEFSSVNDLGDALAAAREVTTWHLVRHSSEAGAEIFDDDLGVYVWTVKMGSGFAVNVQITDRHYALAHTPDDAKWMAFEGPWTLREVEFGFKSEKWSHAFLTLGAEHFHESFTERSVQ